MIRKFTTHARNEKRGSFRQSPPRGTGDAPAPQTQRPRLNRAAVDRAWEEGAAFKHADYKPRQTNARPYPQRDEKNTQGNSQRRNSYGSNAQQPSNPNERSSARPYQPRRNGQFGNENERPFPPRRNGQFSNENERPYQPRRNGQFGNENERPYQPRRNEQSGNENERPYQSRNRSQFGNENARPYQPRQNSQFGGNERPYQPRRGGQFGSENERPYQPRQNNQFGGNERPYQSRNRSQFGNENARPPQRNNPNERPPYGQRSPAPHMRWSPPQGEQVKPARRPEIEEQANAPQFEGDYESFVEDAPQPPRRPFQQGVRTVYQRPNTPPSKATFHMTRLEDGRVLKGSRPAQRKQEQFWTGVSEEKNALLSETEARIPSEKQARKKASTPRAKRQGKGEEVKVKKARGPKPSQKGHKWPSP